MDKITELSKALGEAIAEHEIVKNLKAAQEAYNNCAPMQAKMTEYNANRAAMGEEFKKEIEKQDPAMLEMIKKRIDELGREIVSFKEYGELAEAQKKLQTLMASVNSEIQYRVFGIRPEANECTHDCSSCSGCH